MLNIAFSIRPERWTVADLAALPDATDDEDRADELAFVCEWFPVLVELHQRTHAAECW
jgi:hypothetical protein